MMNFDAVVSAWINADPLDKDYAEGALLLLRLDRNRVFYAAAVANPQKYAAEIERRLAAHLSRRADVPTKEETENLVAQAENLNREMVDIKSGKRADHDSLPPEIRKLYEDNLTLRQRRSLYHAQIQLLRHSDADCSRTDIRNIVGLLKKTDIQYRKNWKDYDSYGKE